MSAGHSPHPSEKATASKQARHFSIQAFDEAHSQQALQCFFDESPQCWQQRAKKSKKQLTIMIETKTSKSQSYRLIEL